MKAYLNVFYAKQGFSTNTLKLIIYKKGRYWWLIITTFCTSKLRKMKNILYSASETPKTDVT